MVVVGCLLRLSAIKFGVTAKHPTHVQHNPLHVTRNIMHCERRSHGVVVLRFEPRFKCKGGYI